VELLPNTRLSVDMDLREIPDRDRDGFLDSLDHCPDTYGLYAGCPKPRLRDAIKQNIERLRRNQRADPLTLACNTLGYIYRRPTNGTFREFLGRFNDGDLYMNNVTGAVAANTFVVSFKGLMLAVGLGQWNSGLDYRKRDTLVLSTDRGVYQVFYDSLNGVMPRIMIPSTAVSAGFHFRLWWLDLGYTLGRQFEDIVVVDLVRRSDGETVDAVFDNDWWFHQLHIDADIDFGALAIPSAYVALKFPFGSRSRTGWNVFETGVKVKFRPKQKHKER
jgi:hypothetical protein